MPRLRIVAAVVLACLNSNCERWRAHGDPDSNITTVLPAFRLPKRHVLVWSNVGVEFEVNYFA